MDLTCYLVGKWRKTATVRTVGLQVTFFFPCPCVGVPFSQVAKTIPSFITGAYIMIYSIYIRYVPHMAVCQNLVPLVNIKIAGKWMFIPLKMVLIGIDP